MGDTLSLFAVGIALFVLFVASYWRRGTWIAAGSMAMSMALLFGLLFLVTIRDRSELRSRLAWAASTVSLLLDRETAERLATALTPVHTQAPRAGPEPVRAATSGGWYDPTPAPHADPQSPIAWDLDQPEIQSPVVSPWGFSIGGTNISGEALERVEAVLKPDSSGREYELVLDVEENLLESEPVIPAGARFSLISANPDRNGLSLGGAILTFRYVQGGQRKTSILYLTPSMFARFADRG